MTNRDNIVTDWKILRESASESGADIDAIARMFSQRLKYESEQLAIQDDADANTIKRPFCLSNCALYAPRLGNAQDKATAVAKRTAFFFSDGYQSEYERIRSFEMYKETVSKLARAKKAAEEAEKQQLQIKKKQTKMQTANRIDGSDELVILSDDVLNPTPIPVDSFASPAELGPMLDYLKHMSNTSSNSNSNSDRNSNSNSNSNSYSQQFIAGCHFLQDGRLDLCKQSFGPRGIKLLMEALSQQSDISAKHRLQLQQLGSDIHFLQNGHDIDLCKQTVDHNIVNKLSANNLSVLNTLNQNEEFASEVYSKVFSAGCHFLEDGRLDLCKQSFGPNGIKPLIEAMLKNAQSPAASKIKHFLFGNNIGGMQAAEAISSYILDLGNQNTIETWYLAGNDLNADGIGRICEALSKFPHICRSIWLKRNPVKLAGVKHIAALLLTPGCAIKTLDLSYCGLLDEGCEVLFETLKTLGHGSSLRHLYLDANGITAKSAAVIGAYISSGNCCLKTLYLSVNHIRTEGAQALAAAFTASSIIPMKRFSLSSNGIGSEGIAALLYSIASCSRCKLQYLDIGFWKSTFDLGSQLNSLEDAHLPALLALLASPRSKLRILGMALLGLSEDSIWKMLATLCASNNTLLIHLDYAQQTFQTSRALKGEINRFLDHNNANSRRRLKHGKNVFVIDSMYRNEGMQ